MKRQKYERNVIYVCFNDLSCFIVMYLYEIINSAYISTPVFVSFDAMNCNSQYFITSCNKSERYLEINTI